MSFSFRKFSINDENTPMKVGVDSVILGAWVKAINNSNILDIGSGSGIISIMLAQRFLDANIDAVELNEAAYSDLEFNINNSPWQSRISPFLADVNDISKNRKYHLIVSNPPYFSLSNGNVNKGRESARQQKDLSPNQICNVANSILKPKSSLVVIFPHSQRFDFILAALSNNLYLWEELKIKDNPSSNFKRCILVFKNYYPKKTAQYSLIIKSDNNTYSNDFYELTKEFYLSY